MIYGGILMITVLLIGSEEEVDISNVLIDAIKAINASTLHLTAKSISVQPHNTNQIDFLIVDNMNISNIDTDRGIAVFKQKIPGIDNSYKIPSNFIAVTDSENNDAVSILLKNGMQTVTCGLSQKDSITFSSRDDEDAVVSLQREIKTLNGNAVFPHEIPIKLESVKGEYPVLAAIAVLLIAGNLIEHEITI